MSVIDEIKSRLDIVDYVSATVKLRHTGKNYTGFCPFHSNTRTPAFVIFPETQTWRCFGQCNEGGDIFGFVMKKEGWDFAETLKFLAEKAGVELPAYNQASTANQEYTEKLVTVLEAAERFYRQQLVETEAGKQTLDYLHQRGLNDQTIKIFGIGHAPDEWEALLTHLKNAGYDEQVMLDAGLITTRDSGGGYDRFRNRVVIPIRNTAGKICGFGGRVLNKDDVPKYLNSPKTELFDKGRILYGLDLARQPIRTQDQAVIVEGYMDVIGLYQAGFTNAVSPMGTALTEDQFRLLKKYTRRIILALDPDAAGEKATLRGLETARHTMDVDSDIRFDARGLMHIESRLKADIRVTTLPDGKDPDEIALADPQQWEQIIAEAKPVVEHVMETLAASKDVDDAKVKSEIAQQILPLIDDVSDREEREAYRQKLAHLIKVDERALIGTVSMPTSGRRRRSQVSAVDVALAKISAPLVEKRRLEKYCIQFLMVDPYRINNINEQLGLFQLPKLMADDFSEGEFLEGFRLVVDSLEQIDYSPKEFVESHLSDELRSTFSIENSERSSQEISYEKQIRELVIAILRIRRNKIDERNNELMYMLSEMTEDDKELGDSIQATILEGIKMRMKIDLARQPKQEK